MSKCFFEWSLVNRFSSWSLFLEHAHICKQHNHSFKWKLIRFNIWYFFPHSGQGVLLEGKLLDLSRHAITDVNNQKVLKFSLQQQHKASQGYMRIVLFFSLIRKLCDSSVCKQFDCIWILHYTISNDLTFTRSVNIWTLI